MLSQKSQKIIKNEKDIININSTGNINNKRESIRNHLNNIYYNNIIKNKSKRHNILSLSPISIIINSNSNGLFRIKQDKDVSKKQIVKIFSDSNINKNKNNSNKTILTPSLNIYSYHNKNNKNYKVQNISPENSINNKVKNILKIINKIENQNLLGQNIKNEKYNLTTNNNHKTLTNKLNLNLIINANKNKEINDIKNIKDLNINDNKNNEDDNEQIKNNSKRSSSKNSDTLSSNSKSSIYDYNYYMNESNQLSEYIKNYYKSYNKYPESKIFFYKFGRTIGQGSFGKVNIGLHILTGRVVAIKSFKKESNIEKNNKDNIYKIINEKNLMKDLDYKNVIKILDYFEDKNYIFIVMEYINGGNLYSLLKKRRKLQEKTAKLIFKQIILALKYIHSRNIVHRDIKLENILLDLNNGIKICDFGIGKKINNSEQLLHGFSGTPLYMAPEIILSDKNKGYKGFPVDIWSSGILLYIMLSGALPFKGHKPDKNKEKDNKGNKSLENEIISKEPKKIKKISDNAHNLLQHLLCKDPSQRITCDEILNHPWFNNYIFKRENITNELFTENEKIILSKAYIDYRKNINENLKEYFNISNLYNDTNKNKEEINNILTKSNILTPFNSMTSSNKDLYEKNNYLNNKNIKIENDILEIGNKVKEHYRLYELNNNNEIDNGIMIYSHLNSSSIHKSFNSMDNDLIKKNNKKSDKDLYRDLDILSSQKIIKQKEKKINNILNQIEKLGYKRQYILKCIKNNEINYATASYFLMSNYEDII